MGKTEAPKTISRYTLVMTLSQQYNGNSPFVIQKDGREVYDFQNDKLIFTCCKNLEHKHTMSPLKMLQLVYIYGSNPCPICNPNGLKIRTVSKKEDVAPQEDGSIMSETKKYLQSDDPTETAKRLSRVQLELDEEKRKLKELEKKQQESEEDIVESIPYDDYIENENPDYDPNKITTVDSNNNIEEKTVEEIEAEVIPVDDDSDIIESETYDDYVLENPDYNEKIIGNEKLNEKPKSKYDMDYLFRNSVEEGSMFAIGDESVREDNHENEAKEKHKSREDNYKQRFKINLPQKEYKLEEIPRENDTTNITNLGDKIKEEISDKSTSETEKLNENNTNILLSESKETEKPSSDDEEEEFDF